jgi:PKD repeat protein
VQRSQGGGGFAPIANLGASATSYSNTGLAASTEYTYRVLAKNAGGSSDFSNTATATTSAPPPDTPPVARYTWTCGTFNKRTCTFNGSSSTDDKGITSYAWAFGNGKTGSGATVNHRFSSNGTYQVTLTVKDAINQSGTRTCAVKTGTSGTCAP